MLERLQKIIARAGIASRRHAEELIRSGQVRVNGAVVTELGAKADPDRDRVEAAGQVAHRPAEPAYYVLFKPAHVVATMSDPEGRATLRHVLRGLAGGVFPVGRLDYAASGLLLLTSDGQLADRMLKVSGRIPKVYWFKVKGQLSRDSLREIGHRARARLRQLSGPAAARRHAENPWYEVELSEARRDLLRQGLFAAGHPVEKLKRVSFGPLELGNLAEGHYRELQPAEISRLRQAIERAEKAPQPVSSRRPVFRARKAFQPFRGLRQNPPGERTRSKGFGSPALYAGSGSKKRESFRSRDQRDRGQRESQKERKSPDRRKKMGSPGRRGRRLPRSTSRHFEDAHDR